MMSSYSISVHLLIVPFMFSSFLALCGGPRQQAIIFLGLNNKEENESLYISLEISLVWADELGLSHVVF